MIDLQQVRGEIDQLVAQAEQLLAVELSAETLDPFLSAAQGYLDNVEAWRTAFQTSDAMDRALKLPDEQRAEFKAVVMKLVEVHDQVTQRSAAVRDDLKDQIIDVHRRAKGLKRYIDQYPSRITIAGKRKG